MARQSNKPALEVIQAELADPDYKVRKAAIKRLMRYQRAQAVESLLPLLEDARADVRIKAVQALGRLADKRALVPLLGLLNDKSVSVRAQVAGALGAFGDRSAVRPLHDLLNDPKPRIRQAAARSLGQLRDPASLPLLLAHLKQAEEAELYYLVRSLGDFNAPAVIEPLLTVCEASTRLQGVVAEGLSRLGPDLTPVLERILLDQSRAPIARRCVALAFGRKPRPETTQTLIQALGDSDDNVRHYAAWALGCLRDPVAIEPLIPLLSDRSNTVRRTAILALSALNATEATDALITCLSSMDRWVAYAAAGVLMRFEAKKALPALLDVLCQWEGFPHQHIVNAVCSLGGPAVTDGLLARLPTLPRNSRLPVVCVLERFPDARFIETLLAWLDPHAPAVGYDHQLQIHIVSVLGRLGDIRALGPLSEMRAHTTGALFNTVGHALQILEARTHLPA